jgi:diguanylate cyclase (GGDEF)-like protein
MTPDINYMFIWLGTVLCGLSILDMLKVRRALSHLPISRAWLKVGAISFLVFLGFVYFGFNRPRLQDPSADRLLSFLFYLGALCVFLLVKISVWTARDLLRVAELERDALNDPLTGLFNRRFLDLRLAEACREQATLAVCIIDIDCFKRINDTYGHPAGDQVIREIGQRLSNCLRAGDTVARFGGEEYVVTLRGVGMVQAKVMAERLRRKVEVAPIVLKCGSEIRVTISVGVDIRRDDDTPEALLARTDRALYAAKQAGRNCVRQTAIFTAA